MVNIKPVFNRPEDEISKKVEDKVKVELDNRIKSEVDKRIADILKEREEKENVDKASKIAKAVNVAKAIKTEGEEKDKEKAERERVEKDILCPTCHTEGRTGHIHRVDTDKTGLIWKCNGKDCGFEAVLTPMNSDYKCAGCGMAIKKPVKEDLAKDMVCPFCRSKKANRFEWSKLWNVLKKNK